MTKDIQCQLQVIPNKATNGDVIKALFPNVRYKEGGYSITLYFDKKIGTIVPSEWWNARYKEKKNDDKT